METPRHPPKRGKNIELPDLASILLSIVAGSFEHGEVQARGEIDTLLPGADSVFAPKQGHPVSQRNIAFLPILRRTAKEMTLKLTALLLIPAAWPHDAPTTKLTWTREISRLVTQRCVTCHQPGGRAPFSLLTYADARPWAVAIKEEVLQRRMPPWPAAKGFGEFANDISLPQEEINRLAEWAEGGAPEGDPEWLRPVFAVPAWRPVPIPPGTRSVLPEFLAKPVSLLAIRGSGTGKVWAQRPGGAVIPLAWLTGAGKPQWLIYREPILLPAGTRIHGPRLTAITR